MKSTDRCVVPGCHNHPMLCRRVCRDHNPRPWADDDGEWRKPLAYDDGDETVVEPDLWEVADLTPHIEALNEAARDLAARRLPPPDTRTLRVRTQIVAIDEDLGCMVAAYNADTGELIGIGVDPPSPERRWGRP